MILGEIREYLKKRRDANLNEIANHFDISQAAACFALDYWIDKGKVTKTSASCGSSCNSCNSAIENYQWIESGQEVGFYKMQ